MTIPFEPARFRSAAAHYLRGRPDYSPALIRDVATLCGLDGAGRLLDLGCGPGQLAIAFRPFVAEALGMDPEPEMLALAERQAEAAGVDVAFRQGSSYDLALLDGPFRLATIGRAFHWMDRAETTRLLADRLTTGGAMALLSTEHPAVPDNAWRTEYDALLRSARGRDLPAWRRPGWVRNEAVLLDSPLSSLHRVAVVERRQSPGADLVDRALSMSGTTRHRLGEAGVASLREQVAALVASVAQDGLVIEVVESSALIARRPHA